MRFEKIGVSLFGAIAFLVVVLAIATVWLFLTNPVTVATAVSEGEVTPFVQDLAEVVLRALQGLLKYPVTNELEPPAVESVAEQLAARRADAMTTLELLEQYSVQVEADRPALENPGAVLDYLGFFTKTIGHVAAECARIVEEIPQGVRREQVDVLRQIASNTAAEQRRCLIFRDRWINKPLPHERMRPLLNEISITTRDQLTAFRDLNSAADRLERLLPKPEEAADPEKGMDRRALFIRLFKP